MIARPDDPDAGSATTSGRHDRLSVSARDVPLSDAPVTETSVRLLRRLVDEAAMASQRFQDAMDGAARREARAQTASVSLQERLRLGARMLHAQQAQIERLERVVGELQSARAAAEQALERLDTSVERRLEQIRQLEARDRQ
ncbi:MAG: hypothetical protein ACYTJ0_02405 [Planctomycetota bacterium]|jgi:hypothetical protein